jgi:exosortase
VSSIALPSSPVAAGLDPGAAGRPTRLSLATWVKIVVLGVLMALVFRFDLTRLWQKTNPFSGELSWQHAMFVPLIGLYFLYVNRDRLLVARVVPAWSGLGILLLGLAVFEYGIYPGRNDWLSDAGMVITLFGLTLLLCGWEVMRVAWFPILFLFCAIPWPALIYSKVALPLQQLAAWGAVEVLNLCGVNASQTGTKIYMGGFGSAMRTLNVAEACAGLRSLMTFISVAGAIAFLSVRPLWQKLVIMASAVPIAIFCNVMRVSVQGLLDHYVSQELSEGFAHATVGMIMLLPAFFLILLVGWAMDQIYIEEADPTEFPASTNLPAEAVGGSAQRSGATAGAAGQGKIIIARRRAVQAPAARGSEGS